MFKKTAIILAAAAVIVTSFALALAQPDGNYRKGKYLFRKNCRSCHVDGGSAKVLEPATYTMAEWQQIFSEEKMGAYECSAEWPESEQDVLDIYTYMYKFAKDSPTPAKCS